MNFLKCHIKFCYNNILAVKVPISKPNYDSPEVQSVSNSPLSNRNSNQEQR